MMNNSVFSLDELCVFIRNGKSISQSKEILGLPITRIETIANSEINPNRVGYAGVFENDVKDYLLQEGDILFSHINSLEHLFKTAIYKNSPEKLVHGMNLLCLRPNQNIIVPNYLLSLLRSPLARHKMMKFANKSVNQASISAGNLKTINFEIPPLSTQQHIAQILDRADELSQKRKQTIDKLDDLLQATFIKMFGDPVVNPMDWEMVTFGELIKLKSGNALTHQEMNKEGHYHVYGGNGVNGKHDEYMFESSKVVIGRVGQYCGVIHKTEPCSWITDNALYVSEFLREVNIDFFIYNLKVANLNQYAGKSAQPLVSGSRIYPVKTIFPPLELQTQFAHIATHIETQKAKLQAQADELEGLFLSLQQRAFDGRLTNFTP